MSLRRPNGFISAGYDPLEVPNAPTIGTASIASATSVSVTFTAPANVGGSAITGYVATARKTSDGTTISGTGSSSPVTVSGLTSGSAYTVTVAAVNSYGLGVSSAASNSVTPLESQLWSWGRNQNGNLGLNDTANRSSPVQIGALTTWRQVAGGTLLTVAVKTDGTLWSWGRNSAGQLGLNNTIYRSSPVQVGALTSWYEVACGTYTTVATKTDGTMWSWGGNNYGQLGINQSPYNLSSPVQIGSLTNWSRVAAGRNFCLAIKTDNTLWVWGRNNYGQLGLGDTVNRSSPVQVGSLTNWYQVRGGAAGHTIAIKTDGTLWSWGQNGNGQLGLNDTYGRSSPVQIGALTNWSQAAAHSGRGTTVIKTSGTLWAWGKNLYGNLGQNDTVDRSSPVQVGALSNWYLITSGSYHRAAIKTDGTLWAWGNNASGQLGQNDTVDRSSPVQVGSLATWTALPQMFVGYTTFAIKG